jgi:hypothetical protein
MTKTCDEKEEARGGLQTNKETPTPDLHDFVETAHITLQTEFFLFQRGNLLFQDLYKRYKKGCLSKHGEGWLVGGGVVVGGGGGGSNMTRQEPWYSLRI